VTVATVLLNRDKEDHEKENVSQSPLRSAGKREFSRFGGGQCSRIEMMTSSMHSLFEYGGGSRQQRDKVANMGEGCVLWH
jgi:hypothetical protein